MEGDGGRRRPAQKARRKGTPWAVKVFFLSIAISAVLSLLSSEVLESAGLILACGVLAFFILLGIVFDIVGVAVTASDERPFHSMAARKVPGAREALRLIRRAKELLIAVGDENVIAAMTCNDRQTRRYSGLKLRLQGKVSP